MHIDGHTWLLGIWLDDINTKIIKELPDVPHLPTQVQTYKGSQTLIAAYYKAAFSSKWHITA
jgi:hypothetical protein